MVDSIYLIGFMGAGKTTVGRALATQLHYCFLDLDESIEKVAGKSIPTIFLEDGEQRFRKLESQILMETSKQKAVVATGGGIVLNESNRLFLQSQANVFFLNKQMDAIFRHLQEDRTNIRPLILEKTYEEIWQLHQLRQPLYQSVAGEIIDIVDETPDEISWQIYQKLIEKGENG